MWIILTAKLPTNPSPPKLSIHWATPWPGERGEDRKKVALMTAYNRHITGEDTDLRYVMTARSKEGRKNQLEHFEMDMLKAIAEGEWEPPDVESREWDFEAMEDSIFPGYEPNWAGAVMIRYKGESIRVFPHEFNTVTDDRLKEYIEHSHELVKAEVADNPEGKALWDSIEISPEKKALVDAAILEGATATEAALLAAGLMDIKEGSAVAPAGWYRCHPEYALIYCHESELKE